MILIIHHATQRQTPPTTNQPQVVLYWYETVTFDTNNTAESKSAALDRNRSPSPMSVARPKEGFNVNPLPGSTLGQGHP